MLAVQQRDTYKNKPNLVSEMVRVAPESHDGLKMAHGWIWWSNAYRVAEERERQIPPWKTQAELLIRRSKPLRKQDYCAKRGSKGFSVRGNRSCLKCRHMGGRHFRSSGTTGGDLLPFILVLM